MARAGLGSPQTSGPWRVVCRCVGMVCNASLAHVTCPGSHMRVHSGPCGPAQVAISPLPAETSHPPLRCPARRLPAAKPAPPVPAPAKLCPGSWLVPLPLPRSPGSGCSLLSRSGGSDPHVDTPHPCQSVLHPEPLPSSLSAPDDGGSCPTPAVRWQFAEPRHPPHPVLAGLSTQHARAAPFFTAPASGAQLEGARPGLCARRLGPLPGDPIWKHQEPGPCGDGSYPHPEYGGRNYTSPCCPPAGVGHPHGSGLGVPKGPLVPGRCAGPTLSTILSHSAADRTPHCRTCAKARPGSHTLILLEVVPGHLLGHSPRRCPPTSALPPASAGAWGAQWGRRTEAPRSSVSALTVHRAGQAWRPAGGWPGGVGNRALPAHSGHLLPRPLCPGCHQPDLRREVQLPASL